MKDKQIRFFTFICRKPQKDLKNYLEKWMRRYYDGDIINGDGFLYVRGTDNVLLTAHMDTVHKNQCKTFDVRTLKSGKRILSFPDGIGGDDRCGIFIIMKIVETTKLRPSILFCEDEEIGSVGAKKFIKTEYVKDLEKMMFLVELDRANEDDLVFYNDDNDDFHDFCAKTTGYKKAHGSRSDISVLSPECKRSSVNLSCGYYNAHKTTEYVEFEEMMHTVDVTIKLITEGIRQNVQYEYKSWYSSYSYYGYKHDYGYDKYYGRSNYYDDDYDYYSPKQKTIKWYKFILADGTCHWGCGYSYKEAIGDMMIKNRAVSLNMVVDVQLSKY